MPATPPDRQPARAHRALDARGRGSGRIHATADGTDYCLRSPGVAGGCPVVDPGSGTAVPLSHIRER